MLPVTLVLPKTVTRNALQKLIKVDKKLIDRPGKASELIRQLVQIGFGKLTSEEAKGKAWDRKRLFNIGKFGAT
jgi:hypothetical protein